MKSFKEYLNDVEKKSRQAGENSDTLDAMNEGIMKRAAPYVAAGLSGLASAFGIHHALKPMPKHTPPAQVQTINTNARNNILKREENIKNKQETPKESPKDVPKFKKSLKTKSLPKYHKVNMFDDLIPAIAEKETGHLPENKRDRAIGDRGKAYGRYQVHEEAVLDVNKIYKTNYTHKDMFNPAKARDVLVKYLAYWGKHNKKENGIPPTHKNLAAMWNGGPNGWKKEAARDYARDVVRNLTMYASN
jgi:hypothetical protein